MRRAVLALLVLVVLGGCSNEPAGVAPAASGPQDAYVAEVLAAAGTSELRRDEVITAGRNTCMSIGTQGVTRDSAAASVSRQLDAEVGPVVVDAAARLLCPERQFSTQPPPGFDLVGSISLADPEGHSAGPGGVGCQGDGGYSDLQPGAGVTVADAAGTIVAVGSLTIGVPNGGGCDLYFEVTDVPSSEFYQVSVANRGTVTYTEDQARGGEVMLTIGG